jgi:uncharacterized protein YjiS (DUF1127 family)
MNTFSKLFAGFSEGIRVARFHRALNQMSDRQLADIGISRDDIARRAIELAQKR